MHKQWPGDDLIRIYISGDNDKKIIIMEAKILSFFGRLPGPSGGARGRLLAFPRTAGISPGIIHKRVEN